MYTRREIGKLALAGLPCAAVQAKPNSKVNGVLIGVQSYSFRDRPLDAAIQAIAEVGLSECELWSGHVEPSAGGRGAGREELRKWRLTTPLDHFREVRRKFDRAGIQLYAYNYSFRDDFTDEEIARGFEMARAMRLKYLTASSTLTAARRVAPFADKARMVVAMHGHSNLKDPNEFATPDSFEAAMRLSRYFRVNLDIGHFWAAGFDPVEYIDRRHKDIVTLHVKDRKRDQGPNMPFGEGDTPIRQVLQLLKTKKYRIPANIEYEYKGADAVAEVRRSFQYCKEALVSAS
jgi:sugar phosphate isomerase/epimerase